MRIPSVLLVLNAAACATVSFPARQTEPQVDGTWRHPPGVSSRSILMCLPSSSTRVTLDEGWKRARGTPSSLLSLKPAGFHCSSSGRVSPDPASHGDRLRDVLGQGGTLDQAALVLGKASTAEPCSSSGRGGTLVRLYACRAEPDFGACPAMGELEAVAYDRRGGVVWRGRVVTRGTRISPRSR